VSSKKPKNPGFKAMQADFKAAKNAAAEFDPNAYLDEPPSFRFARVDLDPSFPLSLCHLSESDLYSLRSRLASYEGQIWREIEKRPHCHPWNPADLDDEAADRAEAMKLLELYQIDIDNMARLFGIRNGSVFSIVWWDPDHDAYHTKKKRRSQR
jgi:hypothetical protein